MGTMDPATATAPTLAESVAWLTRRLRAAGVEDAPGDARLLAIAALGLDRVGLHIHRDRRLTPAEIAEIDWLGQRREAREPVSRIVGHREFWSLDFALSPATLDPRPDSETLVQAALERFPDRGRPLTIVDLGTGSGCLLIALLTELPAARGIGVDASDAAAAMARRNADRLGVVGRADFVVSDWASALAVEADLVVSNPPYIARPDMAGLAPEVTRFDPDTALLGGDDGLDAYRDLAPVLPALLGPGGSAILEVGDGQAEPVRGLLADAGLVELDAIADLAGVKRCICGKKGLASGR